MFTGIIEELGTVIGIDTLGDSARLSIRGATVTGDAAHGDSISVNGVCLTVVDNADGAFTADVMGETLTRSTLGALRAGSAVNLERAATVATRLGGHIVQGHVDGVGEIIGREAGDQWETVTFALPEGLGRYVVEKGSITVDGISLTVMAVTGDTFSVGLIPTTLKLTTLGAKGVGERVNLEVDIMAKYVEKLLGKASQS
ncbi:riboflavin synthase [Dactylosporangium matsuzakiense]|uniref:Riboflavin synthase n=1 Tax=Dactylosporangium matsuzakiense TaxID=53360 RepID=A0A9W6NNH8_9ACTN|nr:riboflavin synthase [Dactylosporangium matsuzakiense]UWZ42999.1 riboflavin synthase [Dactylosporangium matsuzakiense]GLL03326.1 riboflavin synthase subunit alpha [Dactylosporangium matsuzakiense]